MLCRDGGWLQCYSGQMRSWFNAEEDKVDSSDWLQRLSATHGDQHLRSLRKRWAFWRRTFDRENQVHWCSVKRHTQSPRIRLCRYFTVFLAGD